MATSRILGPDGKPIELDVLQQEIAAPAIAGIRQVWHAPVASHLTPQRLSNILLAAIQGDANPYLTLAEEMEERDMHYASVLGTRKLALVGLDVRVESATDDREDVRRADAIRELTNTAEFGEMMAHLVDALGKGYAVSEIVWDRSGREWAPQFVERDPRFFRFDRETGRELRLLDAADPAHGIPLAPYKFVVHQPRIRSGLPIRGGLARLAAPSYMCKAWTWRDWMSFADIYGLPMRVGTYGPGANKEDIAKLMAAVANLGSDAAAVMPDSVRIAFEQAANVAGAGDFFSKLASFWDKQISKGVLGQTMTADDGASLSQAEVHQLVRLDIMTADAKAFSNTLQRQVVRPHIDLNFGPGPGGYPRITIVVPKPENTAALVDALQKLVPMGLTVEQSVVRDKLGIPDPEKDAVVLQAPAAQAAPAPGIDREADVAPVAPRPAVDVQAEALNGAQVKSLQEVVNSAARGEIPLPTVKAMIRAAFPLLSADQIEDMIAPLAGFTPNTALNRALNAELPPQNAAADAVSLGVDMLSRATGPELTRWVAELSELVNAAGSLEAVQARLIERFAALSITMMAQEIAQALAAIELAGRAEAQDRLSAGDTATATNAEQAGGGVISRGWEPAAAFFGQKVNVPTERWNDLWQGQHARAFVVAGATKEALLTDLRAAVDSAIREGTSYDTFRQRFEEIVERHGWTGWTGEGSEQGRDWRARTIWQTNLSTAHAAGRYQQLTDPDALEHMPFWQYRHNSVTNPREAHKAWDGMVLRWDDPWWATHYPPNGWRCRCDVRPVSERMLRRMGKAGPDKAPGPGEGDPPPEWAYNVGETAWGKPVAKSIIEAERGGRMVPLDTRGPADFQRPASVAVDAPVAQPIERVSNPADLREAFRFAIGGDSAVFADPTGARVNITDALVDHWLQDMKRVQGREQYLPLLREVIEQPFEVWIGFAQNELTGKVELRRRYVKAVNVGNSRVLGVVADAVAGQWVGFNFFSGGLTGANNLRLGMLLWGRPE